GRRQREDLDEVAVGGRVAALPVAVEREREEARDDRRGGGRERAWCGAQRGDRPDDRDEDPGGAPREPEGAIKQHRGKAHPELKGDRWRACQRLRLRRAEEVARVRDWDAIDKGVSDDREDEDRRGADRETNEMRAAVPRRSDNENDEDKAVARVQQEREAADYP